MAFDAIEERAERWPALSQIISCLPVYQHEYVQISKPDPPQVPRIESDAEKAIRADNVKRAREAIEACARKLSVTLP